MEGNVAGRKGVGTKGWEHFNTMNELLKNILKKKKKDHPESGVAGVAVLKYLD